METKRDLKTRLRSLREGAGLTIDKLAQIAGISSQVIKDIEAGRRAGGLDSVIALSRAFNLTVEQFLDEEYTPKEIPVSQMCKVLLSIPDRVYFAAKGVNPESDVWDKVVKYLEIEKMGAERKSLDRSKNKIV